MKVPGLAGLSSQWASDGLSYNGPPAGPLYGSPSLSHTSPGRPLRRAMVPSQALRVRLQGPHPAMSSYGVILAWLASYGRPYRGHSKAGPSQASIKRGTPRLQHDRPRPGPLHGGPDRGTGPYTAAPGLAVIRWTQPGSQTAGPSRTQAGPSIDGHRLGLSTTVTGRVFIRRALAEPSVSGPQPGFRTAGPSWIFIRRVHWDFHTSPRRQTSVGPVAPSDCGHLPGHHKTVPGQTLKQLATADNGRALNR